MPFSIKTFLCFFLIITSTAAKIDSVNPSLAQQPSLENREAAYLVSEKPKDKNFINLSGLFKKFLKADVFKNDNFMGNHFFKNLFKLKKNHPMPVYVASNAFAIAADYVYSRVFSPNQDPFYLNNINNVYGKYHPTHWKGHKIIYVRSIDLPLFFSTWFRRIKSPFILISGVDDFLIPTEIWQPEGLFIVTREVFNKIRLKPLVLDDILSNPYLIKWYTQNYDFGFKHEKMGAIPIGLGYIPHENRDLFGEKMSTYLEQEKILLDVMKSLKPTASRKFKVYSDTHLNNSSKRHKKNKILPRKSVYDIIKDNPVFDFEKTPIKRTEQWKKRGTYVFSLSLIGNGLDCHRTWESLILGNIVLLQSSPLDPLFEDLPVIIIKDFNEINEENLKKWALQYHDAFDNPKYRDKLKTAYWISKIENSIFKASE